MKFQDSDIIIDWWNDLINWCRKHNKHLNTKQLTKFKFQISVSTGLCPSSNVVTFIGVTQMSLSIVEAQKTVLSAVGVDAVGNTVDIPGEATCNYTSSDPQVFSVTNINALTADGVAVKAGTAIVSATLTVGAIKFTSTLDVVVTSTLAGFKIVASTPV